MTVEWPGRRGDVANAPEVLAEPVPSDLDNAIHWLIDDVGWDLFHEKGQADADPATTIGLILRDAREVAAVDAVLVPLLAICRRHPGPAADSEYLGDPGWPEVAAAASAAIQLIR